MIYKGLIPWQQGRETFGPLEDLWRLMETPLASDPNMMKWMGEERAAWVPKVDIEENENEFVLSASLPGMKKEDIRVEVEEDSVTLHGERKFKKNAEENGFHRVEQAYGTFHRTIGLPGTVATDRVEATYCDGILTVRVPKAEGSKKRVVDIQ